jgi:hypothetical protein
MRVGNSRDENNFGISSTARDGNPKIVFLKASLRLAFKKTIFKMRISGFDENCCLANDIYVILKKLPLLIML